MRKFPTTKTAVTTLKQPDEGAAYLAFLVERAETGRRDPVRHSHEDVEADMEAILAEYDA
jgi:hypothetical protein